MNTYPPTPDFDGLSTAEKILRLQEAWDRIAEDPRSVEVTAAQKDELDARLEVMEEDPDAGASWEEIRDEIRKGR